MAGLGNVAPSIAGIGGGGHAILDLIFRDCALILSNTEILYSNKIGGKVGGFLNQITEAVGGIPLPIVGFSFETPQSLNILQYDYTEYPMYGRLSVVNSMTKGMGEIVVRGLRPITRGNPVALNYTLNQYVLIKLIETYADAGGLWTLHTMWGTFNNLVLTALDGEQDERGMGGVVFKFSFKRVNFDAMAKQKSIVSKAIKKLLG